MIDIEHILFDKASALWDTTITSEDDINHITAEIDPLITSFEGLKTDLEDLFSMKKALRLYRHCYNELNNEYITWDQFHVLEKKLTKQCELELHDDEIPWDFEEVLKNFVLSETKIRNNKSKNWVSGKLELENIVEKMSVNDANQLLNQISSPPLFLTMEHRNSLNKLNEKINNHLNDLSIEWLLEKFKELSILSREEFLKKANKINAQYKA